MKTRLGRLRSAWSDASGRRGVGFVALAMVALAPTLGAMGCGEERADIYESQVVVTGPVAAGNRFVYLHQTFGEMLFITPGIDGSSLTYSVDRIPVGDSPLAPIVSPDGQLVMTINGGDQTLAIVEVDTFEVTTLELPSDYDALTLGPNSRFVVAHYENAALGGSGDSVFRNQNEITVFDLQASGTRLSTVDAMVLSLRSAPRSFTFAPSFTMQGTTHHMLVVTSDSTVTLVDLLATTEADLQRRIFLVPENAGYNYIPRRVLFTEDDPTSDTDMKIFILAQGSQDIFEVSILPPAAGDSQALALSLNQFPAGVSPADMLLYRNGEGAQKLLILNASGGEVSVVDVATGNALDLDISWHLSAAETYIRVDPDTGESELWALLYAPGQNTVVFTNLDTIDHRGTRAMSALVLGQPVSSLEILPVAGKAVVVHSGSRALSVINLAQQFDIRLPGSATVRNSVLSPDGSRLYTTVAELPVMAMIDLENGHPSQIDLPRAGGPLALVPNPQVLLVDHLAAEGELTLLNAVDPNPKNAVTVRGLFLESAFEFAERYNAEHPEESE